VVGTIPIAGDQNATSFVATVGACGEQCAGPRS
jgi:hypothetical protein